jgi:hypothetical protein
MSHSGDEAASRDEAFLIAVNIAKARAGRLLKGIVGKRLTY